MVTTSVHVRENLADFRCDAMDVEVEGAVWAAKRSDRSTTITVVTVKAHPMLRRQLMATSFRLRRRDVAGERTTNSDL